MAETPTGKFVWYEYICDDLKGAVDFYTAVVGWSTKDAGMSGFPYEIVSAGPTMVGGITNIPDEARAMGARPGWDGYISVENVDAAVSKLTGAGGRVLKQPADMPGVGRFAVVADPYGAVFMLFHGSGEAPPPPALPGAPGLVGWRELHAGDGAGALSFYAGQFGWKKERDFDMGPMGLYHLRRRRRPARRHNDQGLADSIAVLALLFQRRRDRRGGRTRQGERRADRPRPTGSAHRPVGRAGS